MERYGTRGEDHSVSEVFWSWLIKALAMPALLATPARTPSGAPLPASRLSADARQKLTLLLGASGLREDNAERVRFSEGHNLVDLLRRRLGDVSLAPDGVLYPWNAADVQGLLTLCAELDITIHVDGIGADFSRSHARPARWIREAVGTLRVLRDAHVRHVPRVRPSRLRGPRHGRDGRVHRLRARAPGRVSP